QQSIANTLKLAIKNNKLASAYMFCGPRGVGKTTCARIFAKAINCYNPRPDGEACEECESCTSFNEQRSINIQELNASANNSVDDIRAIIDQVRIPPQMGRYKVIILDEVHMLSNAASNALLKTLEEPPSYVIFILATTEKQKILQTILSRCQIFDFNRMEISDIVGNLKMVAEKEGINYEEDALCIIAEKADGGMRDALSVFDQINNFSQGNITRDSVLQCINALDSNYYFQMTDLLIQHNVVEAMLLFNDIVNKGFNGGVFISGLASHCRDLLMSRTPATLPLLNVAQSQKPRYTQQANACSLKFLYYAIRSFDKCSNAYKDSYNKRLSVEITLIEAAQFSDEDSEGAGRRPAKKLKPLFKNTATLNNVAQQAQKTQQTENKTTVSTQDKPLLQTAIHVPKPIVATGGSSRRTSLKDALKQARDIVSKDTPQSAPTPVDNQTAIVAEEPAKYPTQQTNNNSRETSGATSDETFFYSAAQVEKIWKECSDKIMSTNTPMAQRMLAMPLECRPDHTIIVSLHNEIIRKQFIEFVPFITKSLNNAFHLSDISIETTIMPQEVVKVITNPSELLTKMRTENSAFGDLVDQLNLQLC
ncbi:MAG: DNA polymerase III subunit gamma/tau, partial [Bacteroidaceae bacterium]